MRWRRSSITSRRYPLDNPGGARRRSYTVRLLVYAAVVAGAFVALSLVSFWLAVRPPRIAIPLGPGDYGLTVENVTVKGYVGVVALQTCGDITVTKNGRVAAATIQAGGEVSCEGHLEGSIEVPQLHLGPKSAWKGGRLTCRVLSVEEGAKLDGSVTMPRDPEPAAPPVSGGRTP